MICWNIKKTNEEHLSAVDEVLQRLTDNNMKINPAKSHFGNTKRYHTCKDNLKAVEKAKIPETKEELKSF